MSSSEPAGHPTPEKDGDLVLDPAHIRTMREAPGRSGGTLLAEFMELFYREEPKRIATLSALAREGRFADLAREAHTVAGSSAMLGARELRRAASALEVAATEGNRAEVDRVLGTVNESWKRLCHGLTNAGFPPA
ncbi:MAG: Hpt domain-containing protein [Opitutaceae bacterium]